MYAYFHTLSVESCETCDGLTTQILNITEDTDEMVATIFFTCLTCHEMTTKSDYLIHWVNVVRPNIPHLTRCGDTNWFSRPKES